MEHEFSYLGGDMGRLAGRCGIPYESERVYVQVECTVGPMGDVRPYYIDWAPGRRYEVTSCSEAAEWGRWEAGNVVRRWHVEIGRGAWRELWWERGRFFVRRRDVNGEGRPMGAPVR